MAKKLTKEALMALAKSFCQAQSKARHRELFGVTDAALESSVPGIEKIL